MILEGQEIHVQDWFYNKLAEDAENLAKSIYGDRYKTFSRLPKKGYLKVKQVISVTEQAWHLTIGWETLPYGEYDQEQWIPKAVILDEEEQPKQTEDKKERKKKMSNFNPNEHMMSLKGKQYLQVMWRLVWFREEHPNWDIETTMLECQDNHAIFVCKILDDKGNPVASGHGSESARDFGDYIEKAETKAIGRALAILGYGTQFAPEMDECEDGKNRIVDSPVEKKTAPKATPKTAPKPTVDPDLAPMTKTEQLEAECALSSKVTLDHVKKAVASRLKIAVEEVKLDSIDDKLFGELIEWIRKNG